MSIETTINTGGSVSLVGHAPARAKILTRNALRDIADKIEAEAKIQAPRGDTGALKEHPVDVHEIASGFPSQFGQEGEVLAPGETIETRAPTFGGGVAVRGPGGRFVRSTPHLQEKIRSIPGEPGGGFGGKFDTITIRVAREPKHAILVHEGTGIYGPRKQRIVPRNPHGALVFHIDGRKFVRKSVRGQEPQPFLTEAYVIINNTYIPLRVEKLQLEINAIT